MKKTIHCPVCKSSIGIWTLVRSPTPTRYRCPDCKNRLQLVGRKWTLYLIGVLYGLIITISCFFLLKMLIIPHGLPIALIASGSAYVILLGVSEIVVSLYVLKCKSLEQFK